MHATQDLFHYFAITDVIWTKNSTLMLLNLYETKLNLLDNPKKKSKMWTSMAEELKTFNIEVRIIGKAFFNSILMNYKNI